MNSIIDFYNYVISQGDPRTRDWFLVWNSPVAVLILCVLYFAMIFFGKHIMKTRKEIHVPPYVLFSYNASLVILSAYMFKEIIMGVYLAKYDIMCAKLNVSYSEGEMKVVTGLWLYFVSKAIEFLDTFFMVIRKKFNQITFLHCFHHSSMLLIWWMVIMFIPSGQVYFGAAINTLIHCVMYSYYGLSAIPSLRDKLWWKKYLTNLQMIQFFICFVHTIQGIVRGCDFPKWGQYFLSIYMLIMIILFANFYRTTYGKKPKHDNKFKQDSKSKINTKESNNNHNVYKNGNLNKNSSNGTKND